MANHLTDYLQNTNTAPLIWIEPAGYATQAFAGGKPDWQAQAQSCSSVLAQANSALKSQVISVDVAPALFLDAAQAQDDDSALSVADNLLQSEAAIARAVQVSQAVAHTLAGQVDLVLRLPSPAALLHRCGAPVQAELDFDDLDDAAMVLAGLTRRFAECKFSGLMLASDINASQAEEEFDTLGAIFATAKHYRWATVLRVDAAMQAETAAQSKADIVLLPNVEPSSLGDDWTAGDSRVGGGLSQAFWQGQDFQSLPSQALPYGDAPADLAPEKVLARAAALRG